MLKGKASARVNSMRKARRKEFVPEFFENYSHGCILMIKDATTQRPEENNMLIWFGIIWYYYKL